MELDDRPRLHRQGGSIVDRKVIAHIGDVIAQDGRAGYITGEVDSIVGVARGRVVVHLRILNRLILIDNHSHCIVAVRGEDDIRHH